jgi:lysyl-tRNA synthetase class 2
VEAETPILQPVHGGANARPFVTHSNAYDIGLYLRTAPELYLERPAVGGLEPVFEIGRNFRNEGVDVTHNPEFMLEAYEAYGDYTSLRTLARDLILSAAGDQPVLRHDEHVVDLREQWPVVPVYTAVSEAADVEIAPDTTVLELRQLADELNVAWRDECTAGQLVYYEPTFSDRVPRIPAQPRLSHRAAGESSVM